MAFNIKQFGDAVTMAITNNSSLTIPPGWNYDAYSDTYKKANGIDIESISFDAVRQYGGILQALAAAHMGNQIGAGVKPAKGDLRTTSIGDTEVFDGFQWNRVAPTGAIGSPTGGLSYPGGAIGANGPAGPYDMSDIPSQPYSMTMADIKPASSITMKGKLGDVTINLDTGELTMPPGVGRDAAIRDFWLGFQENFQPTNKAKYEQQIKQLQQEVAQVKAMAALMKKDDEKEASKKVAEKIAKKYNGEKFIMVKPEDLIRFIEADE